MRDFTHWLVVLHYWDVYPDKKQKDGKMSLIKVRRHEIVSDNLVRQNSINDLKRFKKLSTYRYRYGDRLTIETEITFKKKYKIDYREAYRWSSPTLRYGEKGAIKWIKKY